MITPQEFVLKQHVCYAIIKYLETFRFNIHTRDETYEKWSDTQGEKKKATMVSGVSDKALNFVFSYITR